MFGFGRNPDVDHPPCPYCGFALKPVVVVEMNVGEDRLLMSRRGDWYCNRHGLPLYFATKSKPLSHDEI